MTRGRERRCVLAGLLAGLLVAALRRVCGALPPRWWRSDHDGVAGVPVRTRPDPRAGRGVAVALRRAAVRVRLGPGAGQGGGGPADGGSVLRPSGPISSRRRCRGRPTACGNPGTGPRAKATVAPWWGENSKEAYASGLSVPRPASR